MEKELRRRATFPVHARLNRLEQLGVPRFVATTLPDCPSSPAPRRSSMAADVATPAIRTKTGERWLPVLAARAGACQSLMDEGWGKRLAMSEVMDVFAAEGLAVELCRSGQAQAHSRVRHLPSRLRERGPHGFRSPSPGAQGRARVTLRPRRVASRESRRPYVIVSRLSIVILRLAGGTQSMNRSIGPLTRSRRMIWSARPANRSVLPLLPAITAGWRANHLHGAKAVRFLHAGAHAAPDRRVFGTLPASHGSWPSMRPASVARTAASESRRLPSRRSCRFISCGLGEVAMRYAFSGRSSRRRVSGGSRPD